jgi:hypothetical protein
MKPKLTPEQKRLLATAHNKALGPTVRAQALAALKRSLTAAPTVLVPVVRPRPLTAFEAAQAKAVAARELETWARDAASRLQQANTLGRTEEAESIRTAMRARGLRPIGDPDPPVPEREPQDLFTYSHPTIGKPHATVIVEWRDGGWQDRQGD